MAVTGLYPQGIGRDEKDSYNDKLRVFKIRRERVANAQLDVLIQGDDGDAAG